MPVLQKSTVRTSRGDLLSERTGSGKWHLTGGSTGTPTQVFRDWDAQYELLRNRYRFHASWGLDIFDRWAHLWGHAASFTPGLKGYFERVRRPIEDYVRNRLRLSAYRLGSEDLQRDLSLIAKFDPVAIYSYSTAGYLLARECEKLDLSFPSLKLVNLTAEPAFPHIVAQVERSFGVPCIVEYGSCECGFLAGEAPDRTIRIRDDYAFLESLPRNDGRYDIVITVLTNSAFPLIRYAMGDVTDKPIQKPAVGFSILSNIGGRDNDLIVSHDGEPLHCLWFDDVIENYSAVRRYRIHQHARGNLTVTCELTQPNAQLDTNHLTAVVQNYVGYPVEILIVTEMPLVSAAGKHRWIMSDMAVAASGKERHDFRQNQQGASA